MTLFFLVPFTSIFSCFAYSDIMLSFVDTEWHEDRKSFCPKSQKRSKPICRCPTKAAGLKAGLHHLPRGQAIRQVLPRINPERTDRQ